MIFAEIQMEIEKKITTTSTNGNDLIKRRKKTHTPMTHKTEYFAGQMR